ncbi:hypothetical protein L218DRAFT_871531 [Marasmius fiardii PR-910]|nr:hypothetical protein L218DRAFT_871531 [Marasmius fiardii PR-910]
MTYCQRCDRHFPHWEALYQHKRDSGRHWVCGDCDKDFASFHALQQHYVQSPRHSYCQRCDDHFDDDDELEEHYLDEHHFCPKCRQFFTNQYGLEEHFRQSERHHYCADCKREFQSESNLRSHRNSSIHQPKNVKCPFSPCNMTFVSRSALLLHLEGGRCPSRVDRDTVNRVVQLLDKNNVITDPRLITGPDQNAKFSATEKSWNGYAYECYICHSTYRTLPALNQHLASPRHEAKVYFCPLSSCHVRFTTLSALCQHIESQRCGVAKFKAVQNALDGLVGGMKLLAM